MYNNNYQIVQTPQAVLIVVEMVHDARIIPISKDKADRAGAHRPAALNQWLGDPVGWWEGDTLVVETTQRESTAGDARARSICPSRAR